MSQEVFIMSTLGKTAIVTGGAQGIGRAIAFRLARDGANVAVLDLNGDEAECTTKELKNFGVEAAAFTCDVTDYKQVKKAVSDIHRKWNTIDILINNAGIDRSAPFVNTNETLWDLIINVNYRGFLIASHVCIPYMIEQKS